MATMVDVSIFRAVEKVNEMKVMKTEMKTSVEKKVIHSNGSQFDKFGLL